MLFFRNNLKQGNERLLQSLSNAVRASALIEDMISRNLDTLIQETSRTESGAGDSGARRNGGRRGNSPDRSLRARLFGGSPSKSKKGIIWIYTLYCYGISCYWRTVMNL